MKSGRVLAGAGSGIGVAIAFAAGGGPVIGACTTHQCDSDMVCIDSTGSMKTIQHASECTPIIAGGTPIGALTDGGPSFYNLNVVTSDQTRVWTTSSLFGPWLDFPGQRTYIINYPPGLAGQRILNVTPVVSSDNQPGMDPGAAHGNWTPASGQLAEFTNAGTPQQLSVFNATCVDYGLRLIVTTTAAPADGGPPEQEASPDPSPDARSAAGLPPDDDGATE